MNLVHRFFLETFIELFICCTISVSFKNEIPIDERTVTDDFSVKFTYILLGLLLAFMILVSWFSLAKANHLHQIRRKELHDHFILNK